MKTCTFNDCQNKHDSHGYCAHHARQYRKYGHPLSKEEIYQKRCEQRKSQQQTLGKTWTLSENKRHKGVRRNTGRTHFMVGQTSWNKGTKGVMRAWNKGKKLHYDAWNKGLYGWRVGKDNPNWKGGVYTDNNALRRTKQYKAWRTAVFERDDYTCQMCFTRGGYLEADHIKQFAFYPELRFDINNGRTLCKECHMKTPTYKSHKKVEVL